MTEPAASLAPQAEAQTDIIALLLSIARALVDSPDLVSVEVLQEEAGTSTLRLHLGPGDIGKVIGRQGRTARSLRTILSAAGMKLRQRYSLDIVEDEQS